MPPQKPTLFSQDWFEKTVRYAKVQKMGYWKTPEGVELVEKAMVVG
jgi:hypothetical protein